MNFLLDLLFPKRCIGCKKVDTYFCKGCISGILQKDLVCPECERLALGGQTHSVCRKKYGLDGLWSLGIYKGFLKEAIRQLKYGRVSNLTGVLTGILIEYWAKYQPFVYDQINKDREEWAVTTVPLHWWRGNNRGFNQSSLIGQILSKNLSLPYCDTLKRIRYTKPQVKLKGYDRNKNIKDAFVFSPNYQLQPTNYLLIDDVWTTGSTLRECCDVLKRAGAKQVWAITLAR